MSKPEVDYTLVVHKADETGRICIVSPEIPGLLLWARPGEAFADVLASVKKLRDINGMSIEGFALTSTSSKQCQHDSKKPNTTLYVGDGAVGCTKCSHQWTYIP